MNFRPGSLAALSALTLLCIACGPPPATKDVAYGVWLGTETGAKGRVMITFIAPDKAELEFPDDKEKKKEEGKWAVEEGAVKLTRGDKVTILKLSYVDQNDEKKEKLASADGSFSVVKV
jgi:hypothetical protein